jgi:glycosyltransferase involved in cell wall biosynthesis
VLFVTPYYLPDLHFGGPPRKIHAIARGLTDRQCEVTVITFDHAQRRGAPERSLDGVRIVYLPWRGQGLRQVPTKLAALRAELARSQVVHCYGLYNFLCPRVASLSKRIGVPYVVEPLGMFPPRARNRLAKAAYNLVVTRGLLRDAVAVVAASEQEATDLSAIVDGKKIIARRNGIDVDRFKDLPAGDHLRRQWGIGTAERVILFVGRISPIKNLEQLVLAFGAAAIPNARLVLVGPFPEPSYKLKLESLIRDHGLESSVLLAGPLFDDDHRAVLGVADLVVLPSLNESFGNAAGEAVAAGVPVLLTETCGIAPLIHERAGMAVPVSVPALTTGLRTMMDPAKRRALVARHEEVKREISWDEPVAQTEQLYRQIVGGEAAGASPPDTAENTS